ncbi:MAG: hypothetical protein MAG451_02409 [Anaerolineales bacterium]|nr:hypothetical protein [Anaerolineales bacterium]
MVDVSLARAVVDTNVVFEGLTQRGGATVITSNARDFRAAREALGLRVVTPVEAAIPLAG